MSGLLGLAVPETASVDAQVRFKTRLLLADDQTRAAFAAYLDGLEVDGYTRDPVMSEFVAASRALIAEHEEDLGRLRAEVAARYGVIT